MVMNFPDGEGKAAIAEDPIEEAPITTGSSIPSPDEIAQRARKWSVNGQAYFPSEHTTSKLPSGYYVVEHCNRGFYFCKTPMNLDDLLVLPDTASEEILKHIEYFWTREARFRNLGFLWKRGIMLYGPAGGGKTSTLQLLSKRIIEKGGLSIYLKNPYNTAKGLEILRRIEPTRPIIVLLEDIDALIKDHGEAEILAILDGELQIDNVVFIATTNYPEDLDKRLINRPSRFDVIKEIGMPTAEAREVYLRAKNPNFYSGNEDQLHLWIQKTEGFSIAHLKELILAVEALNEPFVDTIKRLRKMIDHQPRSTDNERKIGFVS